MSFLIVAFFVTALIYAAAGFGGGSTYTALLVLANVDLAAVPIVSLCCNILVVSVSTWRFARAGHVEWRRIWPLLVLSVPFAWLGGRLLVAELVVVGTLAIALLVAGLLMLLPQAPLAPVERRPSARWVEPLAGGALGFLAGVVGIGGGIFLAPLLYFLRWGGERAIAATCAVFILVNSLSGLGGQLGKSGATVAIDVLSTNWLLLPAVMVGGMIGSTLTSTTLDPKLVRMLTALLVVYAALRLCWRFFTDMSAS